MIDVESGLRSVIEEVRGGNLLAVRKLFDVAMIYAKYSTADVERVFGVCLASIVLWLSHGITLYYLKPSMPEVAVRAVETIEKYGEDVRAILNEVESAYNALRGNDLNSMIRSMGKALDMARKYMELYSLLREFVELPPTLE